MKIIISHDVDHLNWSEHWKDSYFYGLIYRSIKGLGHSGITMNQFVKRFSKNRLTQVFELHQFNQQHGITATFFFGMHRGLNLSYSWRAAGKYISELHRRGGFIGLHGMQYNSLNDLKKEREKILQFLPENYPLGIRNHYLRKNEHTFKYMNELGFLFDSTDYSLNMPYRLGNMWEIPIGFMDAGHISHGKSNLESIKEKTILMLKEAKQQELPFFVVNFHDTFFTEAFPFHYQWYQWLIVYLIKEKHEFSTFIDAVKYLNQTTIKK